MAVSASLYRFTLSALHALLWLRASLAFVFGEMRASLIVLFKHKGDELDRVAADARSLPRLPLHLALVVQEEGAWPDDLARVAAWAFATGVRYVSLYDHSGVLKRSGAQLRSALVKRMQQLFGSQSPAVHVCTSAELGSAAEEARGSSYNLLLLSAEDGRQDLVSVATTLSQSVLQHQLRVDDIDAALVGGCLKATRGFPDPDLMLVFGPTTCLAGYPPWQTRLTEILRIPTHRHVTYHSFLSALHRYSRCQQRLGK